ncbi:MAG: ABC transporter ATP-binding protein [Dysgonamonadaceae bacterium]|jgi:ABC-2 type transport system ATP-binding protein|nr:ABC transporter ATP-binding protein [Dysgonamonadaceae bacterium]
MIKIENLDFKYGKNKPLFAGFNLELGEGHIAGLLGKNGAGKSTLLRLVAGLLFPQGGQITVNGFTPKERTPDFLSEIYMIPEEFSLPSISIEACTKALSPLYPRFDRQKMNALLQEFELNANDRLHRISHGQRKKFLIAFALATNCRLLLLDEPTNGLDIPSKSQFRKTLAASVSDEQLVVISTHQVRDVDTLIDTVAVINDGRLAFLESTEAISRKYLFETAPDLATAENVIYSEKSIAGARYMRLNRGNAETAIDLELLFNAVTKLILNE